MLAASAALCAGACGGGDDDNDADDDDAAIETTESTEAAAPETTSSSADDAIADVSPTPTNAPADAAPPTTVDDGLELITYDPRGSDVEVRSYTVSALGGLSFDAEEDDFISEIGDRVFVTSAAEPSNDTPGAYIGVVSQTPDTTRIRELSEVYDLFDSVEGVELIPDGTAIELFGYRLVGHDLVGFSPGLTLFATTRRGGPPISQWTPDPGKFYATTTPSGVLIAGFGGEESDTFARLVTSAQLINDGLDPALAPGQALGSPGLMPEPGISVDGDTPVLAAEFSSVAAGRYQIPNFGLPISVEIPDGWEVQPNVPGLVVLTRAGSGGPGDRDLTFVAGVMRSIAPVAGGPIRVGAPVTFVEIDELLDNPPDGLMVTNQTETEVGGIPAVRFDLKAADGLTCSKQEPCDFAWETNWGFAQVLRAPRLQRVWWFEADGVQRFITTTGIDQAFLDEASKIVESAQTIG